MLRFYLLTCVAAMMTAHAAAAQETAPQGDQKILQSIEKFLSSASATDRTALLEALAKSPDQKNLADLFKPQQGMSPNFSLQMQLPGRDKERGFPTVGQPVLPNGPTLPTMPGQNGTPVIKPPCDLPPYCSFLKKPSILCQCPAPEVPPTPEVPQ